MEIIKINNTNFLTCEDKAYILVSKNYNRLCFSDYVLAKYRESTQKNYVDDNWKNRCDPIMIEIIMELYQNNLFEYISNIGIAEIKIEYCVYDAIVIDRVGSQEFLYISFYLYYINLIEFKTVKYDDCYDIVLEFKNKIVKNDDRELIYSMY